MSYTSSMTTTRQKKLSIRLSTD